MWTYLHIREKHRPRLWRFLEECAFPAGRLGTEGFFCNVVIYMKEGVTGPPRTAGKGAAGVEVCVCGGNAWAWEVKGEPHTKGRGVWGVGKGGHVHASRDKGIVSCRGTERGLELASSQAL